MSFSFAVAGDAFLYKLDTIFNNLDFCMGITDDMIIWTEEADGSNHDKYLTEFLEITRQHYKNWQ